MVKSENKNLIIVVLLVVCGILAGGLVYTQFAPKVKENIISKTEAVNLALTYINENLLPEGIEATSTGEIIDDKGLYKFQVEVAGKKFFSYITKDGKILFPQGIDLEKEVAASPIKEQKESPKTCQDIPKSDKPVLEAFVVSYCPFGTQMERILNEIVKNIPELADNIRIKYMGQIQNGKITSMHGEKEAKENLRQICLRDEQKDKFFNYLSCFLREGKSQECLEKVRVNKEKLSQCMEDSSRGIVYAREDFESQNNYGVTGSPTLYLNGEKVSEFDFGGRTAEAVKNLLCCGFTTEPEFCSKALSKEKAATGFSEDYNSGNSSGGTGGRK
ncbi:hypothetical protein J7K42_01365 [bacterium]|nr:hypothetical protein [bacterium]